jgi:hypothetical protein
MTKSQLAAIAPTRSFPLGSPSERRQEMILFERPPPRPHWPNRHPYAGRPSRLPKILRRHPRSPRPRRRPSARSRAGHREDNVSTAPAKTPSSPSIFKSIPISTHAIPQVHAAQARTTWLAQAKNLQLLTTYGPAMDFRPNPGRLALFFSRAKIKRQLAREERLADARHVIYG